MQLTAPRLVIAGLGGDSGKTLVSLGLTGALRSRGVEVAPYKKGPDYIDAAWLGAAAGRPGRNLDTFLMPASGLGRSLGAAAGADLLLVEGNRGLYDGLDAGGTHSTAELAKRIGAPVVLVVDVTKTTRTIAALVLGCRMLDPELDLAGVILNRVATARQEKLIRRAVEEDAGIPVVGAVPRLADDGPLPGRHLGLVTVTDHPAAVEALARAAWDQSGWRKPANRDSGADRGSAPETGRYLASDDFYRDWALCQFGPEVAEEVAEIFGRLDCHLPRPAQWVGGPGGLKPDARRWEKVRAEYAFVDELTALRRRVRGRGGQARLDYWLNNFRYMRAMAAGFLQGRCGRVGIARETEEKRRLGVAFNPTK